MAPVLRTDPTLVRLRSLAMDYRHLGRSGLYVSSLSYGNWITHGSQVERDQAIACVHAALDHGITTFDTADVYAQGAAEEVLGDALRGIPRDSIEIFTKCYWPMGANKNQRGLSRKHIIEAVESSLRRLGVDHVDLIQAHRFDFETPLEETLRAFDDLVRAGKVHYVGVSEWDARQIADAVAIAEDMGLDRIVSNQPQYSLLWRVIEAEVVPTCEEFGIGQIVWSPLAQGVLTGKYLPGEAPPADSRATDPTGSMMIERWMGADTLAAVAEYADLCRQAGHSPAAVALAWVLRNPNVSSAIVGATRPEQITENVAAAELELEDDFVAAIEGVLAGVTKSDPSLTVSPPTRP
jgi:aryl-alcohol dehydrogenase-like predicted oxidoreductase